MKMLASVSELREARTQWRGPVGFVPTMGALHAGHLELVNRSNDECANTIVSIFVNPTQFNDPSDLAKYPRQLNADLNLLDTAGVDYVFTPPANEIYADRFRFRVQELQDSQVLCGPKRAGHFDGVLTVVLKLFGLVQPQRAYFGEKDYQQLRLIQQMVQALFIDVDVVGVPTVRAENGLALSSRNQLLTPEGRRLAPKMYSILRSSQSVSQARDQLQQLGFAVDYVEEHWGRRFGAAYVDGVRLIDNVEL